MERHEVRNSLLRTLTSVPHRQYDQVVPVMRQALLDDPAFSSRALVHFASSSQIRDVVDCSIISLIQAETSWLEYREAGQAILLGDSVYDIVPNGWPGLPPKRLFRVLDYISESDTPCPRRVKTIVHDYFRMMNGHESRAEGAFTGINLRRAKSYWIKYHIRPDEYPLLHELFFGEVVEGTRRWAVQQLAGADPVRKLDLVREYSIGFKTLQSVLDTEDVADLTVMLYAMTPTEASNSRSWVEESGVLSAPEVKQMFVDKLSSAPSIASADHRVSAQGKDDELNEAIEAAKEKAAKKQRRLESPTLLLVDKSSSMMHAIEVGRLVATRISTVLADKRTYVFDAYAMPLDIGDTVKSAEGAFMGITANGGTSIGAGYRAATQDGWVPEFVVIVTDAEELHKPKLVDVLNDRGHSPEIIIVKVSHNRDTVTAPLNSAGYRVTTFQWQDDYYLLEQIESMIGAGSIVERIMETEIPKIAR